MRESRKRKKSTLTASRCQRDGWSQATTIINTFVMKMKKPEMPFPLHVTYETRRPPFCEPHEPLGRHSAAGPPVHLARAPLRQDPVSRNLAQ